MLIPYIGINQLKSEILNRIVELDKIANGNNGHVSANHMGIRKKLIEMKNELYYAFARNGSFRDSNDNTVDYPVYLSPQEILMINGPLDEMIKP
jgi:hypothetical protein